MHGSCFAHPRKVYPKSHAGTLQQPCVSLHCLQPDNCTRADIVAAVTDNPNWTSTVSLITLLNATYLLPDGTGPGTVLLPTNNAFQNLGECLPCACLSGNVAACASTCTLQRTAAAGASAAALQLLTDPPDDDRLSFSPHAMVYLRCVGNSNSASTRR